MRRIRVKRKSYYVRGHKSHSKKGKSEWVKGHKVHATAFSEVEMLPAHRNRVIPMPLEKGDLGGSGFFAEPLNLEEHKLRHAVRKYGYKHVLGKLNVLAVLDKRRNPRVSSEAKRLRAWLVREFGGPAHGYDLHKRRR